MLNSNPPYAEYTKNGVQQHYYVGGHILMTGDDRPMLITELYSDSDFQVIDANGNTRAVNAGDHNVKCFDVPEGPWNMFDFTRLQRTAPFTLDNYGGGDDEVKYWTWEEAKEAAEECAVDCEEDVWIVNAYGMNIENVEYVAEEEEESEDEDDYDGPDTLEEAAE